MSECIDRVENPNKRRGLNGFYILLLWLGTLLLGPFATEMILVFTRGGAGIMNDVLGYYGLMLLIGGFASFPSLVMAYLVYFLLAYTEQSPRYVKVTVTFFALSGLAITLYLFLKTDFLPVFVGYALTLLGFAVFVPLKR